MEQVTRKNGVVVKNPTHKSTSKVFEAEVARLFGSNRTPLSGMCNSITKSDIIHDHLFVECKLRATLPVSDRYRLAEKTSLPIFNISNYTKYKGTLWLVDPRYLVEIESGTTRKRNLRGEIVHMEHSKGIITEDKKAGQIVSLFNQVAEKAAVENKIPMVAVRKKYHKGWLVALEPKHLPFINQFIQT